MQKRFSIFDSKQLTMGKFCFGGGKEKISNGFPHRQFQKVTLFVLDLVGANIGISRNVMAVKSTLKRAI